jgi:ATP-dependent DNA helicase HFM1/MER3
LQLSAVAQAAEFSKIRFRQGEKSIYKAINRLPSIRFPIPVNLDLPAQKVSLIIQSVLGHAEINWEGDMARHKNEYRQEAASIFKSINSLVRCIIDCQICLGDSVGIHSALMLERCLGSRAWDDSPLQMVQVPDIGTVAVRKLVNAGIRSIEDLESTDARRIEAVVGRNPPFGIKVLEALKSYPKLRVSLKIQPSSVSVVISHEYPTLITCKGDQNNRRRQNPSQGRYRLRQREASREVRETANLHLHVGGDFRWAQGTLCKDQVSCYRPLLCAVY